jgi:hypothetical protein
MIQNGWSRAGKAFFRLQRANLQTFPSAAVCMEMRSKISFSPEKLAWLASKAGGDKNLGEINST